MLRSRRSRRCLYTRAARQRHTLIIVINIVIAPPPREEEEETPAHPSKNLEHPRADSSFSRWSHASLSTSPVSSAVHRCRPLRLAPLGWRSASSPGFMHRAALSPPRCGASRGGGRGSMSHAVALS